MHLVALGCYDDAGLEIQGQYRKDKDNALFVLPFWKNVTHHAQKYQLDPYLMAAIMREESRFNPGAISRSGAIGLMQLMPKTARQVARESRLKQPSPDTLKNPFLNMELYCLYYL